MPLKGLRPVPDTIEPNRPITPHAIGKAYDQIIGLWTRADFDQQNGIQALLKAMQFLRATGSALDIGCGCTGRFFKTMEAEGFHPSSIDGVDVSAKMLEIARQKRPDIAFHLADICEWELPKTYDLITSWDSIWHIPLNQQEAVMKKLFDGLNPGGVCLFSCGGVDQEGDHVDDFMGPEIYYSSLGVSGFLRIIDQCGCSCRHLEYDQFPELHMYFIVQKQE